MKKFIISVSPTTKKNSQQIFKKKTKTGKIVRFIMPSKQFTKYQESCMEFMPYGTTIATPINIEAIYYMPSKRHVDITNLHSALHDVLVHYRVIYDDDCTIVASTDGSRVRYSKTNPRTEVHITESNYKCWETKCINEFLPEKPKKLKRKVLL